MATENFEEFALELIQEKTPRSIVIVGSSRIDVTLYEILCKILLPKRSTGKNQDELLEGDTALSTFSSRIKVMYRLGVIGAEFCQVLEKVRDIRNQSAHKLNLDFNKKPLVDTYQLISKPIMKRGEFELVKKKYFGKNDLVGFDEMKCVFLAICLTLEAVSKRVTRLEVNEQVIKVTAIPEV